jgi:transposase-like protein
MKKAIRKKAHDGGFKFAVAIAAIRGEKTVAELCQEYGIVSSQVYTWKKELLEHGPSIYGGTVRSQAVDNKELDKLHATIGRLKVENDFLEKALRSTFR